jgi:predicted ATPase
MHTFKNFKNFADAEIDLSKPMTLLIGRNGSGKSNVIEGVELLAELLKGRQIENIFDIGDGGKNDFEVRGGVYQCVRKNQKECSIEFKYSKENDVFSCVANLILDKPNTRSIKIESKGFLNNKEVIVNETSDNSFIIKGMAILGMSIGSFIAGNIPGYIFWTIGYLAANKSSFKKLEEDIRRELEVHVFDIYPKLMRSYNSVGDTQLAKDGSNISSVLFNLYENKPESLKIILENIKRLPEESIINFTFDKSLVRGLKVIFSLKYENKLEMKASLLSDGTLRALAILTALETVPEGSRIIIEEIDNGVHASRVHVLIEAIWEASNRRHLNTLITTHNPATLDSLNEEQLNCVVVCHYDKQSQSAKLTPFFELPRVYELMERGKLGSLVVKNIIEQYLDPQFEQEQQRIIDEWLESLA